MAHALGYLLVFIGGGLGAVARHGINRAGLALLGPGFPWWTLAVNVAGSFAIGLLAGLFGAWEAGHNLRLFLTTGMLGGFTTFSAFGLETLMLIRRAEYTVAAFYAFSSVLAGLLVMWVGFSLVIAKS